MGKGLSVRLLGSNKLRIFMSLCMSMPEIVHMGEALFVFVSSTFRTATAFGVVTTVYLEPPHLQQLPWTIEAVPRHDM